MKREKASQQHEVIDVCDSEDMILNALIQAPIATQMIVYEDFLLYTSGIYHHVAGEMLGLHFGEYVGYARKMVRNFGR